MVQVLKGYKKELTSQDNQISHRMGALLADAQRYGLQVAGFQSEEVLQCEINLAKARQLPNRSFAALSLK
jgi:hypothetical protein